ncbi:MAG: cupin domain-containing protein [Bacteroidetes bacterium]|nr:cupin domain-containing protein [Bacteroidota bacterium]MBL6944008.1 cupin domain-containing protein [Bacteroidales bacterium]
MRNAQYWINHLGLLPHPEGGHFREVYRSDEIIRLDSLPDRFTGDRTFSTSIYFLLTKNEFSTFHKINSDELWHFYDGDPLTIYVIDNMGVLTVHKLGLFPDKGILPQVTIRANHWFASETTGNFSLVGCTVSPGFDFSDFEIAERQMLISQFDEHRDIIERYTR